MLAVAACHRAPAPPPPTANDAASRLRAARTLWCRFTAEAITEWESGQRAITKHNLNPRDAPNKIVYDNIDLEKGTAREIGNAGAVDLSVRLDRLGGLWIVKKAPVGFMIVTTVFPLYAAGSQEFVVVESRHLFNGVSALGLAEQSSGSCSVIG
jgi:hypothetical protein